MEWFVGLLIIVALLIFLPKILKKYEKFDFSKQQNFFVTGCASGIGKEMAYTLLSRGQRVVATDINLEGLQQAAKEFSEVIRIALLTVEETEAKS